MPFYGVVRKARRFKRVAFGLRPESWKRVFSDARPASAKAPRQERAQHVEVYSVASMEW